MAKGYHAGRARPAAPQVNGLRSTTQPVAAAEPRGAGAVRRALEGRAQRRVHALAPAVVDDRWHLPGRLRLRHDELGPHELEVRFDRGAGATTLHTHLRSLERDEPDSETALADARLDLPLRWRDRQLSARGQVEARALAWREPPSARAELRMAAAGPITSLAIGVLGTAGALAMMGGTVAEADDALRMMAGLGPLGHAAALAGTDQHSARALQLGAGLPASASRYARTWPT
jgi:hypothetical protein